MEDTGATMDSEAPLNINSEETTSEEKHQPEKSKVEECQPNEHESQKPQSNELKSEEAQTGEQNVEEEVKPDMPKPAEEPKSEEPKPEKSEVEECQSTEHEPQKPQSNELKSEKPQAGKQKTEEEESLDIPKATKEPEPKTDGSESEAPKPSHPPRRKVYSIDPSEPVEILMGDTELTAAEPVTIGQMFKSICERFPDHAALMYKVGEAYEAITYKQYYDLCIRVAKSYIKLGLELFHGVGIMGFNAPEWFMSSLGAIFAGGLSVGIYVINSPEVCQFILENSKSNIVVVENDELLQKILKVRDQLPHLKAIVQYKGKLAENHPNVYEWSQFLEQGDSIDTQVVEDKIAALKPGHCAAVVYTSGTTGNPKGVMHSHDTITWCCKSFAVARDPLFHEIGVSYHPSSHISAQFIDVYLTMSTASTVYFAQPDWVKGTLLTTLREVNPTYFVAAPRLFEIFMDKIKSNIPSTGLKGKLLSWARDKNMKGYRNMMERESLPFGWTIANRVVKKVHEELGLARSRYFLTGGSHVREELFDFFSGMNMPILDGLSMTETPTGLTNTIKPGQFKFGSVGKPFPGVEVKLDLSNSPAEGQGEICYRSRGVMMGYLGNEEKTKDAIDSEGWLHSGDLGTVDEDGFYYIIGRIKDIVAVSGENYVAPIHIEDEILREVPFLSNVCVVGQGHPHLTCLVTVKCKQDILSGNTTDDLAAEVIQQISSLGSSATKLSEIIQSKDKAVFTAIEEGINRVNDRAQTSAHKIQAWTLLDVDFSYHGGEIGPTLKMKRLFVYEKYKDTIDKMYTETDPNQ